MDRHNSPPRPDPRHDPQLLAVLAGTLLTGVGLWLWMPAGYAAYVTDSLWLTLNIVLLYPLVEELLFRGVIQTELLRRPVLSKHHLGVSRANLVTSILFVCLHLIHQSPLWALSVLLPSLVMGHFRERYGNLLAPVMLHILFNATWLTASVAGN